jgi:hypothetical protein
MDPSLTLAVFEKLTGFPFDAGGRPVIDPVTRRPVNRHRSWGMRFPTPKFSNSKTAPSTDNPSGLRMWDRGYNRNLHTPVVVYMEGSDAKRYEDVFPSLSFVESDIMVGKDPYLFDDPIGYTEGMAVITNPATGYTEEGPGELHYRKHPTPWDVIYTFRLYSRDPVEIQWLERCFLDMWGTKGSISVERADGTLQGVDYELERVAFFDQGEMFNPKTGIGDSEDRHLSRAFTIKFETYLDNTVQGFGTNDWDTPLPSITERVSSIRDVVSRWTDRDLSLEVFLPNEVPEE